MRADRVRMGRDTGPMTTDTAIRPFRVEVPQAAQAALDDLRARRARTRWPRPLPGEGWARGVPQDYLQGLVAYWAAGYDWRAWEAKLNAIPQFTTVLDGQTVHFLHVRSPEPGALPLVLTHGWPSSPVECLRLLGPLADPRAHGGDPADAFPLVVPSLPGYGFSTPLAGAGWGDLSRVAAAWAELLRRLGYARYAVQGTDAGAGVAGPLAAVDGGRVAGVHLTGTTAAMPFGPPLTPEGLGPADRERAERFNAFRAEGLGYLHLQATRPQTLAYALNDSPVAQLAWMVEKFREWTDPAAALPEDAVDRDQLLTAVTVYWLTGSGASTAHATYEGMQAYRAMVEAQGQGGESGAAPAPADAPPLGVAVFAADTTIRSRVSVSRGMRPRWGTGRRPAHRPGPTCTTCKSCALVRLARRASRCGGRRDHPGVGREA